jgi:hypothetical protein
MICSKSLIASGLCAGAVVLPAAAGAATFAGRTRQGRPVEIVTRANGSLKAAHISWKASCRHGTFRDTTKSIAPFDFNVPGRFRDGSPPRYKLRLGHGMHAWVSAHGRGHVGSQGRWRGRFRVDVGVFRRTKRIDTCHLRNDTWAAKPVKG